MIHVSRVGVLSRMVIHCLYTHTCVMRTCHVTYTQVMSHTNVKLVTHKWFMSHVSESCHAENSHVKLRTPCTQSQAIYEWVMSHTNESCHIWMSHVTYEWVMSHMNESCHIWMSHVTCEWVMSGMVIVCANTQVTCDWVISSRNESCQISMSHATYQWVVSRMEIACANTQALIKSLVPSLTTTHCN